VDHMAAVLDGSSGLRCGCGTHLQWHRAAIAAGLGCSGCGQEITAADVMRRRGGAAEDSAWELGKGGCRGSGPKITLCCGVEAGEDLHVIN
jgi:hypothetical protein